MPSDDLAQAALAVVSRRASAFRSAISLSADELRAQIELLTTVPDEESGAAPTLGKFADGRIDPERFSQIAGGKQPAKSGAAGPALRAFRVLDDLQARGDALFRVSVAPGGDLLAAVDEALAEAGRAFGAARVANLARAGAYTPAEHDSMLERFPFRLWSKAERELAPPLVVEVHGADLHAAGLAAYLDGAQTIVLLVEGSAPAAPLARLVSPGVLVIQAADAEALGRLSDARVPTIAAVLPETAVRFVHAPGGAIEVSQLPTEQPRRPVGTVSVFQQREDLAVLEALAGRPAPASTPAPAPAPAPAEKPEGNGVADTNGAAALDPVGALANWMLAHVDLSGLENL